MNFQHAVEMTMLFSNNQLEKSFTKFKVINLLECKKIHREDLNARKHQTCIVKILILSLLKSHISCKRTMKIEKKPNMF